MGKFIIKRFGYPIDRSYILNQEFGAQADTRSDAGTVDDVDRFPAVEIAAPTYRTAVGRNGAAARIDIGQTSACNRGRSSRSGTPAAPSCVRGFHRRTIRIGDDSGRGVQGRVLLDQPRQRGAQRRGDGSMGRQGHALALRSL